MRSRVMISIVMATCLLAGCGGTGRSQHAGSTDSYGDPYITDAQG